jgi:hypothetical protein
MIDRFTSLSDLKSRESRYTFESLYIETTTRKREKDIIRMVTGCVKKAVGKPTALPFIVTGHRALGISRAKAIASP